jgi:hypothetical protein
LYLSLTIRSADRSHGWVERKIPRGPRDIQIQDRILSKSLDPLWPQFVHDIPLQQLLASSHGSVEVFIPIVQGGEAVVNPSMVSGAYDFANRPFSYLTSSPQPGRLGFESILLAAVSRLFCSSCSAQLSHHPRPTKATASRHPNGHIFGRITSSTPFKVHFSSFWPPAFIPSRPSSRPYSRCPAGVLKIFAKMVECIPF